MTAEVLLVLRLFLAVSLFVFLGWIIWVFWREFQTNVTIIASRRVPPLTVSLQRAQTEAKELHTFPGPEITLGRDPTCELHLDDEVVSAHHARFSYHHSQWWLEDLRSTNGTLLNGEPLNTATVVIVGDVITCGDVRLELVPASGALDIPTVQLKGKTGGQHG